AFGVVVAAATRPVGGLLKIDRIAGLSISPIGVAVAGSADRADAVAEVATGSTEATAITIASPTRFICAPLPIEQPNVRPPQRGVSESIGSPGATRSAARLGLVPTA